MAESNFNIIGAAAASIRRGVTAGFTPPEGGGSFVFGFNSAVIAQSAVGVYYNGTNFAPLRDDDANATGGSVSCAMKRGVSTATTGFCVGLFINLQADTEGDTAYILGLSDNSPSSIVLAKTTLVAGLDEDSTTILRTSSDTYLWDIWHHLRLDAIANPNGDVVLKCFFNDLDENPVTAPSWEAIPGMTDFVDDALGIATAETGFPYPLAGGYGGFYFQSSIIGGRAFVDHFTMSRQM